MAFDDSRTRDLISFLLEQNLAWLAQELIALLAPSSDDIDYSRQQLSQHSSEGPGITIPSGMPPRLTTYRQAALHVANRITEVVEFWSIAQMELQKLTSSKMDPLTLQIDQRHVTSDGLVEAKNACARMKALIVSQSTE